MRCWVFMAALGCGSGSAPTAPAPTAPVVEVAPVVVPPKGPSRAEVVKMLAARDRVSLRPLGGGWTRVGDHLEERVIKSVCGGGVPRLGVVLGRKEIHAFDGHDMVVHDILGGMELSAGEWRLWVAPAEQERPVYRLRVLRVDESALRWRAEDEGPDWAYGADWVKDGALDGLVRIESLDCEPRPR